MVEDFDVQEKKGIVWIKWGDVEGMIIPLPEIKASETGANANVGATGVGVGANIKRNWIGNSIFLIKESGQER